MRKTNHAGLFASVLSVSLALVMVGALGVTPALSEEASAIESLGFTSFTSDNAEADICGDSLNMVYSDGYFFSWSYSGGNGLSTGDSYEVSYMLLDDSVDIEVAKSGDDGVGQAQEGVAWGSSDSSVVELTQSATGTSVTLTAKSKGQSKVVATTSDGTELYLTIQVIDASEALDDIDVSPAGISEFWDKVWVSSEGVYPDGEMTVKTSGDEDADYVYFYAEAKCASASSLTAEVVSGDESAVTISRKGDTYYDWADRWANPNRITVEFNDCSNATVKLKLTATFEDPSGGDDVVDVSYWTFHINMPEPEAEDGDYLTIGYVGEGFYDSSKGYPTAKVGAQSTYVAYLYSGSSGAFKGTVTPEVTSSDPSVISVGEDGVLTAVGAGTTTLTFTYGSLVKQLNNAVVIPADYVQTEDDIKFVVYSSVLDSESTDTDLYFNIASLSADDWVYSKYGAFAYVCCSSLMNGYPTSLTWELGGENGDIVSVDNNGYIYLIVDESKLALITKTPTATLSLTATYDDGAGGTVSKTETYTLYFDHGKVDSSTDSFVDVTDETPHADDIQWLADEGISEGWLLADGTREFRGMESVKRQDMAAFLYRLAGSPAFDAGAAAASNPFSDVVCSDGEGGTPHWREILWLYQSGVSTGWEEADGTRTFRGMDSVKRQDMAAFLCRLAGVNDEDYEPKDASAFSDVSESTPHWRAIMWLYDSGVSTGWVESDGARTFRGMSEVVRQDMAAFLHRMATYGLVASKYTS